MSLEQTRPALRELRSDGEAYQFLLSESDLAVLVLSENVEDCNEAACRMFGVRREAFIGRSPLEFAPPTQPDGTESEPGARERLASALAGLPQWCEWQYRRDDGTLVDSLDHVEAVEIDGVRRLLVRIRDVSRLRRAEAALAQTETRLQQILNNTTTAIVFAKDLENRYLFVNRAFERIVGMPADQIIGKSTNELFPQAVATELRRNDERVVASGETILVEEQVHIGGETRMLLTNKFPLFDTHGEPYAMCGIAADITERKATEEALRRAALAVSGAEGAGVFDVLVQSLASILDMEYVFIALRVPGTPDRLHMLAFQIDGELREQGDYGLAGTPCDDVVGKSFQLYASGVRHQFPGDPDFKLPGIESYAGCPLSDGAGESIGVMSVGSRKPIANAARVEAVLRIFAARAMAELERRRAEEATRAGEAQYRAIFDASEDAIYVHDWDSGAIIDVNPRVSEMSGYSREELLNRSPAMLSADAPEHAGAVAHDALDRARGGETVRIEFRRRNKDGSLHWDEVSLKAATIGGKPRLLAIVREITERKNAEEALRASEEQYRAIFNASEDALVLWDSSLQRVDINPAYQRIFGWTRGEVIGHAFRQRALPTEYTERRLELVRRALAGEATNVEIESVRKSGERFHADLRNIPIRYRGEPHVLAIVRDVTERKRADAERTELEAQLRQAQKMEAIGQLTGGIAHDFNNILTGIMGYLVLAGERPAALEDPRLARHLDQARVGAQRARDLIQQMLMFSRGRKGTPQAVSIAPLIAEAASLLHSSMPATIDLRTELERALPQIKIDPVQFEQVLLNLCINARDAMNGAGTMQVRALLGNAAGLKCTSCKQRLEGRFVEIAVEDSGHGMAPEVLERVFEPFFSTKEVGRGSGMGLASVHGIVHEHGGHIVVDTVPGKGTAFRIALPALEASAERSAEATSIARSPLAGALRGRVLLVDDERMVADFMAELLESWGLKVKVKRNPLDAEAWFERNADRVQVVVTDQTMPKMTGLELARRLRARRPGLPVILYTGYAEGITEKQLAASGVRTLMRKPIEPADLRAELVKYLGGAPEASAPEARGPSRVPRKRKAATAKAATRKAASGKKSPRKAMARKTKGPAAPSRASTRRTR